MKKPEYSSLWKERAKEEKRRRQLALKKARAVAKTLKEKYRADEVILFGSLAEDKATAFSDADILIVVKDSAKRFIDRSVDFAPYFQNIGVEVDLFVYTKKEIEHHTAIVNARSI